MHLLVNTGGGDAPGLNAVIHSVVLSALRRGWKVTGVKGGYEGLLSSSDDGLIPLTRERVRGIAHVGGTILGTKNKGHPFAHPIIQEGKEVLTDVSDVVVENYHRIGADAMIVIGGDGSMTIAQQFLQKGMNIVGVPKTIDNDLSCTQLTFGFDTAVMVATEAIDRLHTTAASHERVMVVEVMGRYAGWIALNSGVAGSADVILIPEIPFDWDEVCTKISHRYATGANFAIVVVAEGAKPKGGQHVIKGKELGRLEILGGIGHEVAQTIAQKTGKETRSLVLGHLQRGGSPTPFDRLLSQRFGAAAVRLVAQKDFGKMVALDWPDMVSVPIAEAISKLKTVPLDSDTIQTARDMGISLGG